MRDELVAGVEYIKTLVNIFYKLDPVIIEVFGERLAEILCQKYMGHWYPEKPVKGQAYRCIRINHRDCDESIMEACAQCGLNYQDLTLPKELTMWIDPFEVSCRLGEENYPYTVARFDPKTPRVPGVTILPVKKEKNSTPRSKKCSTPTPQDDFTIWGSSPTSSPSSQGEDSDSGIDVSSEDTAPLSCSFTEENVWWNLPVESTPREPVGILAGPSYHE
ncbi:protein BTG4-like [Gastrophryne carolinensis]